MSPHVNILDRPEPLRGPLVGSLALHVSAIAVLISFSWIGGRPIIPFGDLNPGGGGNAINVNVVKRIPMPGRSGIVNPLANDTESAVPKPPPQAVEERRVEKIEPDAVQLRGRESKRRPQTASSRFRTLTEERSNQLYSETGQALVSPMIGQTGGGGVGLGPASPFGNRFGYYAELLRQKVAEKWRTNDVDSRLHTAPPVVVTFVLLRDGSVRDVRIVQRSGNTALDYSAQRAIYDASPFPPLPAGYERSEANIEFWFVLKR